MAERGAGLETGRVEGRAGQGEGKDPGAGRGRRAVFDIIPARVMTAGEMDNVTAGSAAQLQAVSVRLCRTARQAVKKVWIRFLLVWLGLL